MASNLTSLGEINATGARVQMPLMPHDGMMLGKPKKRPRKRPSAGKKKKASPKPATSPQQRPPNPKPNW